MTAIVRWRPSLLDEFEGVARDFWDTWQPVVFRSRFSPRMDVYEKGDDLIVKTELPGIEKGNLDISLEGDMLRIEAEKKQREPEDTSYYASERYFGRYYRSVELPFTVDAEKVSATYENGILEIRLPKAEEAKPKHIEVKVQ